MRHAATLLLCVLISAAAFGQTVRVSAGQSSLLSSGGASVSAFLPAHTVTLGGGISSGRAVFGASDSFMWRDWGTTLGTSSFTASVDGAGLSEQVTGLSLQRTTEAGTVAAFAGAVGLGSSTPFFQTSRVQHAGAGLIFTKQLHSVRVSSLAAFAGGQRTALESAVWSGKGFRLAGSAGWLNSQPLWNASGQWQPLSFLGLGAYHQTLWVQNTQATADNASVSAHVWRISAQASALRGVSQGRVTLGQSAGLGFRAWHIAEQSAWYHSDRASFVTHTVSENFSRWSLAQTVTQSGGKPSVSFGGAYHSNRISVSVDHSVLFFPMGKGFAQVTGVSISLRIPHTDAAVSLSTQTSPTGRVLYSVSGEDYLQTHMLPGQQTQSTHAKSNGKFLIVGTVTDADGQPVEGAALSVGGTVVFTNAAGEFQARVKTSKPVTVEILCDDFQTAGRWECKEQQRTAQPGQPVRVVVSRVQSKPVQAAMGQN